MPWLVRDGEVLASAEAATTRAERRRGLLGRESIAGVLVLRPCRQVHSFGMRFPLDVIWCDESGRVLRIAALRPQRMTRPVLRSRFVLEAELGAATRWGLNVGDHIELVADADR
jgi:uncharacterized protein